MSFTSTSPIAVLTAVRAVANAKRVTPKHFTSPDGSAAAFIEVPGPGVVHPAHLRWVAACLGQSTASVRKTLEAVSMDAGVPVLAAALEKASGKGVARLRALGVEPKELVLHRVPVSPGAARPNVTPKDSAPVLSPVNAALEMFFGECQSLAHLVKLKAPDIIIRSRGLALQSSFVSMLEVLRSGEPLFVAQERSLEPLVIPPPRNSGSATAPGTALSVVVEGRMAVMRFPFAIGCVDLESGAFTTHGVADANLVSLVGGRAWFTWDAHLVVFDTRTRRFRLSARRAPRRMVVGACCGVFVLDTRSRKVATMPGPLASSGHDVAVSACGRYGWMYVFPRADEVGVFSIERLERVHQPWPHPELGFPGRKRDLREGHDLTVRALARTKTGTFRLLYGNELLQGRHAGRLERAPEAAAFDAQSDRLVTLQRGELHVHRVDGRAQPKRVARWSLEPMLEQLAPAGLMPTAQLRDVMRAAGTVGELAQLDVAALRERLYLGEDEQPDLAGIISAAKAMKPNDTLLAL